MLQWVATTFLEAQAAKVTDLERQLAGMAATLQGHKDHIAELSQEIAVERGARAEAVKAKAASEFKEQAKARAASGQRDRAHRAEQEVGDLKVTTAALEHKVEQAAAANEKLTRALKEAEQQVEELRKEKDLLQERARSLEKAQGKALFCLEGRQVQVRWSMSLFTL